MTSPVQKGEIGTDFEGIINLFAQHLYPQPDSFLRELLQNAHDSIVRRKSIDRHKFDGFISIEVSSDKTAITIDDNGCGMDSADLVQYFARIGKSGTAVARQHLQQADPVAARNLIGQFGIGILSAFAVAKLIRLESLKAGAADTEAVAWESNADTRYEIHPAIKSTVGTRLTIVLKDNLTHLADHSFLEASIRKYAEFLPDRILLSGVQANTAEAPWDRAYRTLAEFEDASGSFVRKRYKDFPLAILPLRILEPNAIYGILYISDHPFLPNVVSRGIDLYSARMFITSSCQDLLPEWAGFLGGILDISDLQPIVARNDVKRDSTFYRVKEVLSGVVLEFLKGLSETKSALFGDILSWHESSFIQSALLDDSLFEVIGDYFRFDSNINMMGISPPPKTPGIGRCSIADYVKHERQRGNTLGGKIRIRYALGPTDLESLYKMCNARGLAVLCLRDESEEKFFHKYVRSHSEIVECEAVEFSGPTGLLQSLPDDQQRQFTRFENLLAYLLRATLPSQDTRIETRQFEPASIPLLVVPDKSLRDEGRLQRLLRHPTLGRDLLQFGQELFGLDTRRRAPVMLYINSANPLMQMVSRIDFDENERPWLRDILLGLYNWAIFQSGPIDPAARSMFAEQFYQYAVSMISRNEALRQDNRREHKIQELKQASTPDNTTPLSHVTSIFVMMPFDDEHAVVRDLLRDCFEMAPYFFRVTFADERIFKPELSRNVREHIRWARAFVAELTTKNPNVMFELGAVQMFSDDRPILILNHGDQALPADVRDLIYIRYDLPKSAGTQAYERALTTLRTGIQKIDAIEEMRLRRVARFLSPRLLTACTRLTVEEAEALSKQLSTVEEALSKDPDELDRLGKGVPRGLSSHIMQALRALG